MPATRSDVQESRRKRLLNTRPVPTKRPDWDSDKETPASESGEPFKPKFNTPDATIPTPTDPRPPPLTLDDLECIKTLGESHRKVLLVRSKRKSHHLDSELVFALKAIPRKSSVRPSPEISTAILANLEWHPFIAGLINTFHDSQNLYLALEYAPHGTLRSLLLQRKMTSRAANFYFANILGAVDFLHIQGIVHRDVKPENILLNSDGYLCLTDFGSACTINESPIKSGAYTAPEWYNTNVDPKLLDWWSCGCILFEMATGKVLLSHNTHGLTWARVGNHLKDLIEQLLDPDLSKRLGHDGASDIAKHPWLKSVDWEKMLGRHYLPPFIPRPVRTIYHKSPLPEQHVVTIDG